MSVLVKLFKLCSTQEKVKKGDNSKSIDARVMYLRHDALPYHTLYMDETSLQLHQQNRGYHPDKKKCQRRITPKNIDARVIDLVHDTFSD